MQRREEYRVHRPIFLSRRRKLHSRFKKGRRATIRATSRSQRIAGASLSRITEKNLFVTLGGERFGIGTRRKLERGGNGSSGANNEFLRFYFPSRSQSILHTYLSMSHAIRVALDLDRTLLPLRFTVEKTMSVRRRSTFHLEIQFSTRISFPWQW